jgi:hypothetical protein
VLLIRDADTFDIIVTNAAAQSQDVVRGEATARCISIAIGR